ncbi:sulfur carrier protein ThiS [Clostridium psychrophilum]|uniref:sulfur carrier protein ThiS n=1 Tax=Clostridium psychrophilum TaxID=132926 RepID=UPI001C0E6F33|nr:sulfur carrier protein ThiS [Clostridium psychrophilum]MBU3182114.1 sulfur carrier protein ThiS [Clostridium psychrophilum]
MKITLNGDSLNLQNEISILALIVLKKLKPEKIVIEYNYNILSKEEWENTLIKENDKIEIISFVVGG